MRVGKDFATSQFSGGPETNSFLCGEALNVVECGCGGLELTTAMVHIYARNTSQMKKQDTSDTHKVARLVCKRETCHLAIPKKVVHNLKKYFTDYWTEDVRVFFTITPGGFISVPFPKGWEGNTDGIVTKKILPLYVKAEKRLSVKSLILSFMRLHQNVRRFSR